MQKEFEAYFGQTSNGKVIADPGNSLGEPISSPVAPSFARSLVEKTCIIINQKSTELVELYHNIREWLDNQRQLEYQYGSILESSTSHKAGWFFLLFVIFPLCAIFDYASINPFLRYLVASSGSGIISGIIGFVGWLLFVFLELATGWLLVYYAKDKPLIKIVAKLLALGLILTPSLLIYTTYSLTEPKSEALLFKTLALIVVSLILHTIIFLANKDLWASIFYLIYLVKRKSLRAEDPRPAMKNIVNHLQSQYGILMQQSQQVSQETHLTMLTNIACYVRWKITNSYNIYDLSDFVPERDYKSLISSTSKPS